MSYYSRRAWRARPRKHAPGRLRSADVKGIALHWPGIPKPIRGVDQVKAALRGWQILHQDDRGWSDIAYQVAVDQDGNWYRLRGLRNRSAANGNELLNGQYGAILLVLGPDEHPTPAMIRTTRKVIRRHRFWFRRSTRVVGHGQIRPGGTDCPGAVVRQLIDQKVFG